MGDDGLMLNLDFTVVSKPKRTEQSKRPEPNKRAFAASLATKTSSKESMLPQRAPTNPAAKLPGAPSSFPASHDATLRKPAAAGSKPSFEAKKSHAGKSDEDDRHANVSEEKLAAIAALPDKKTKITKATFREKTNQKVSSLFTSAPDMPTVNIPRSNYYAAHGSVFSHAEVSSLSIHPHLIANLQDKMRLKTLTLIQRMTIPRLLRGQEDALVKSPTGTGKTLAYAIPLIQQLQAITPHPSREQGTLALILVPTRELALQTLGVMQQLLKSFVWIVPGVIMGGEKKKAEKARLRKGLSVIIATPGRLVDHLDHTSTLNFQNVRWLVLDEADRLMDQGFEKDINQIIATLQKVPKHDWRRRSVLVSATINERVRRLANISLKNPVNLDTTNAPPTDDGPKMPTSRLQLPLMDEVLQEQPSLKRKERDHDVEEKEEKEDTELETAQDQGEDAEAEQKSDDSESEEEEENDGDNDDAEEEAEDEEAKGANNDDDDDIDAEDDDVVTNLLAKTHYDNSDVVDFNDAVSVAAMAKARPQLPSAPEGVYETSSKLKQYFVMMPCKQRLIMLAAFLRAKMLNKENSKAIVFMSSRELVGFHHRLLSVDLSEWYLEADRHLDALDGPICGNVPLFVLHGGMNQDERTRTFTDFSATKHGILLATDVAARGLHLPKVNWIIQTCIPTSIADYIHRVGRTARMDMAGQALVFVMPEEVKFLTVLAQHHIELHEIKSESILASLTSGKHKSDSGAEEASRLQFHYERAVQETPKLLLSARKAYLSFIKAYSSYPTDMKAYIHVKNLHLGHLAKSFALRDSPTDIAKFVSESKLKRGADKHPGAKRKLSSKEMQKKLVMDEFGGEVVRGPRTPAKRPKAEKGQSRQIRNRYMAKRRK